MVNGPAGTSAIPSGTGGTASMSMDAPAEGDGAAARGARDATDGADGGASTRPGSGPGSRVEHERPRITGVSQLQNLAFTAPSYGKRRSLKSAHRLTPAAGRPILFGRCFLVHGGGSPCTRGSQGARRWLFE